MELVLDLRPVNACRGKRTALVVRHGVMEAYYAVVIPSYDVDEAVFGMTSFYGIFRTYQGPYKNPWSCEGLVEVIRKDKTLRLHRRRWWQICR